MIEAFFKWWLGELASLIPGPIKRLFLPTPTAIVATLDQDRLIVALHERRIRPIGEVDTLDQRQAAKLSRALRSDRARMVLALRPEQVLTREVSLPLAAEEGLADVMRYEIDRLTPFSAEEIYYGFEVRARDAEAGTLILDLYFLARSEVRDAMNRLTTASLSPQALDILGSDGRLKGLNLLPQAGDEGWNWSTRTAAALSVACIGFAGLIVGISLMQQENELTALRAHMLETRRAALAQQEILVEQNSPSDPLVISAYRKKTGAIRVLDILAAVTGALPDHSYLQSFRLDGDELRLSGYSTDATSLIPRLDALEMFDGPEFTAPITREAGAERFSIRMPIREAGE